MALLIMSGPGAIGFYAAMGAVFERNLEVAPGFYFGGLVRPRTGLTAVLAALKLLFSETVESAD